jgi:hypothetical protein
MAVISNVLLVSGIILTVKYGIIPLIMAQVVVSLIRTLINIHYANKFIHYPLGEQFVDMIRTTLPGLISFALIFVVTKLNPIFDSHSYIFKLLIFGGTFSIIFFFLHFLFKSRALHEIIAISKIIFKGKSFKKPF